GGVWGSSPKDVWAVAETGVIAHWDGKIWRKVESGTQNDLNEVWGTGPADAWIVGDKGTLLHWNGTIRNAQSADKSINYKRIFGSKRDNVLMISSGNDARLDHILRFDGSVWTTINDRTRANLEGIW